MTTYLLLDAGIVRHHQSTGVESFTNIAEKDTKNGVFFGEEYFSKPSKKWDARIDNGYPTIIFDPSSNLYRLYYTLFIVDESATSTPLEARKNSLYRPSSKRKEALAVAESQDGIHWIKPELGIVDFEGSTANNLLIVRAHGAGILLDEDETDLNKRYKMVTRMDDSDNPYMAVAYSNDGIHFTKPHQWNGENPRADSHNAPMKDPKTGNYIMTTREWRDGARVAVTYSSQDFETWHREVDILKGTPPFNQIYSMPIFRHREHYIGFASLYHEGDRNAPDFDLVDCELATAYDLDSWSWINQGQPLIERGKGTYPDSEFDAGCIYASVPITIDNESWIYYFGGNGRHTGFRETSLGRARIDLDKLAGYRKVKDAEYGRLLLGPFHFVHDDFSLLAEIPKGDSLSWRLVTSEIEQDADQEFQTLDANSDWHDLSLSVQNDALKNKTIYVELRLKSASVFGIKTDNSHKRFR